MSKLFVNEEEDEGTQMITLRLFKVVLQESKLCRAACLAPPPSVFLPSICLLLNSTPNLEIQTMICEIFSLLSSDDPVAVRLGLSGNPDKGSDCLTLSTVSKLMKLAGGEMSDSGGGHSATGKSVKLMQVNHSRQIEETFLSRSSATAIACMSDSSESNWPVGTPSLTESLKTSGFL